MTTRTVPTTVSSDTSTIIMKAILGTRTIFMRSPALLPSRERLIKIFEYNAATGELIWRRREGHAQFNSAYAGRVAGRKNSTGCLQTNVDGVVRLVHRIVFKLVFDAEPNRVRHVNGDVANNRPHNLVAAPLHKPHRAEQKSKNKSGITGVLWNKSRKVWFGLIQSSRARHYVGRWKTLEDPDAIRTQMNAARARLPDGRKERYKKKEAKHEHTTD